MHVVDASPPQRQACNAHACRQAERGWVDEWAGACTCLRVCVCACVYIRVTCFCVCLEHIMFVCVSAWMFVCVSFFISCLLCECGCLRFSLSRWTEFPIVGSEHCESKKSNKPHSNSSRTAPAPYSCIRFAQIPTGYKYLFEPVKLCVEEMSSKVICQPKGPPILKEHTTSRTPTHP